MMDRFFWGFKIDAAEPEESSCFSPPHSSFLSKPAAYTTHNATQPPTGQTEIWVCYASSLGP